MQNIQVETGNTGRARTGVRGIVALAPPPPEVVEHPAEDGVDLADLWSTLRENWWVVGLSGLLLSAGVLALTLMTHTTFRAAGSLYLGELEGKGQSSGNNSNQLDVFGANHGDMGTEIEILKSQSLVKRAVLESGANVLLAPKGWRPPRYWQWRLSGRDPDLLDAGMERVVARDTELSPRVRLPRTYGITFLTDQEYQVRDADGGVLGNAQLGMPALFPNLKLTVSKGSTGTPKPGTEYDLIVRPLDDVTEEVFGSLSVSTPKSILQGQSVSVVNIDYAQNSPSTAALFLKQLINGYLEQRQGWKTEEATLAEQFITSQLRTMRESLDKSERQLADYRKSSGVVVLSEESRGMVEQLGRFEEQRVAARLAVSALRDMQNSFKKSSAVPVEAYLLGEANDTVLTGLASNLTKSQDELKQAQERYTDDAPSVREARAQVEAQRTMVKNYVNTRLSRAQEQLGAVDGVIRQFDKRLKSVPHAELELAQLTRDTEVFGRMYTFLLERQQQIAIVKASTISKNRVLDSPSVRYREDSPTLGLRLGAGGVLGLLLGVALVFARSRMADVFRRASDVRQSLGVAVLGSVPTRETRKRRRPRDGQLALLGADPRSRFAEAFRSLRANLYASSSDHNVLLITSPSPLDGKTTCVHALAASLSSDRRRVLVIDANLNAPSHHVLLDLLDEPGLTDVLSGDLPMASVIQHVVHANGEFDCIAAGARVPGAAEMFSSPMAGSFLAEARASYDFVLLDCASFPVTSDALLLCSHVDRVLSVIRLQQTTRSQAREHVQKLSAAAPQFAVIVNEVGVRSSASAKARAAEQNTSTW